MKFIGDDRIHLYIIRPDYLSKDEIEIIESNKIESSEFRDYLAELKNFYNNVQLSDPNNQNQTGQVLEMPVIIELYPHKYNTENSVRLVAEQKEVSKNLKYIGFHSSANDVILVRIFRDNSNGAHQLHIVAQDGLPKVAHAVIEIKELNKYFFADEHGRINTTIDIPFENYTMSFHSPIAKFEIIDDKNIIRLTGIGNKLLLHNNIIKIDLEKKRSPDGIKIFVISSSGISYEVDSDVNFQFSLPENITFPVIVLLI